MADPHRKRKALSLCERLKIIQTVEDSPLKSRTQRATHFGIPLSTLSNMMKNKDKYLAQARSGDVVTTSKRVRISQLASVDKPLLKWYVVQVGYFNVFSMNFYLLIDL